MSEGDASTAMKLAVLRASPAHSAKAAPSPPPKRLSRTILPSAWARDGSSSAALRPGASSRTRKLGEPGEGRIAWRSAATSSGAPTGTSSPSAGVSFRPGEDRSLRARAAWPVPATRTITRGGCPGPTPPAGGPRGGGGLRGPRTGGGERGGPWGGGGAAGAAKGDADVAGAAGARGGPGAAEAPPLWGASPWGAGSKEE